MRLSDLPRLLPRRLTVAPRRVDSCHSIEDLARVGRRRLPRAALAYLEGGGEDEHTLRRNRAAFEEIELLPRVLRDVADVDVSTTVLGAPASSPLVLAPVGAPRFIHHEGELAVTRAASSADVPYAISTVGSTLIEDVAREADTALWLQLYVWGDRAANEELVDRAKELGFRALVLTADVSVRSKRERELNAGLTLPTPRPSLSTFLEGALHPSWAWHFLTNPLPSFPNVAAGDGGGEPAWDLSDLFDGSVSWDDLAWIRERWPGPVIVKGILDGGDARRAADAGADAVVVSNHGGRQLDHLPATIDALPDVVDAVGDQIEVLFDSGIRRGTDLVTALAYGASAVLIGRAHLYGLAAGGERGVRRAIDILLDELRRDMALCGARTIGELDRDLLRRRSTGP